MTAKEQISNLPDTQNLSDIREIPIDKVGVKNLKYPIAVLDKDCELQHTIATITMTVDLPKEFKGTHMSRFVEILQNENREIHVVKTKIVKFTLTLFTAFLRLCRIDCMPQGLTLKWNSHFLNKKQLRLPANFLSLTILLLFMQ